MEESAKKPQSAARKWAGYLIKYGIPLLVSVLLCRLLFKDVDYDQMMGTIREQCDWRWIGLALVISIFSHIFQYQNSVGSLQFIRSAYCCSYDR